MLVLIGMLSAALATADPDFCAPYPNAHGPYCSNLLSPSVQNLDAETCKDLCRANPRCKYALTGTDQKWNGVNIPLWCQNCAHSPWPWKYVAGRTMHAKQSAGECQDPPSVSPTPAPTAVPTTAIPTPVPSANPTADPTSSPTPTPTADPTTPPPTADPTTPAPAGESICENQTGGLIYAVTGGTCKMCLCSTSGVAYCTGEDKCRVCRATRTMDCKESCPAGHEWKHVSTHSHGCCASFWSCGGNRKDCQRDFPCDGPNGWRGRRRSGDGQTEEIEEIPIEEAEGERFAYLLDDSEYDEEKLKQMTQEELNDFIEELASHPHKSYPTELESSSSSSEDVEDRRLESLTESRLKKILEETMEMRIH